MSKVMKIVSLILAGALILAGCQAVAKPTQPVSTEPTLRDLQNGKPFIYVGNGLGHPVISMFILGFLEACEKYDVECKTMVSAGFEDSGYLTMLDQAIAHGSSGIIGSAYSPFRPAYQPLYDAKIPLVVFHTPVDKAEWPELTGWASTDVEDYGKRSADAMAEKLKCQGPVAITQNTFNDTENLAAQSFIDEMKIKCPKLEVLPPEIEGGDEPAAIAKAAAIITANPKLKGAFGTTGGSPTTWAKAAEQSGQKPGDLVIIGMDYTRVNLDLVKAGWVYAVVGQPLYEEVYRDVELLILAMEGKEVPFANVMDSPIITADMVDKYYDYADRVDKMLGR